jgi:hypothetical protein
VSLSLVRVGGVICFREERGKIEGAWRRLEEQNRGGFRSFVKTWRFWGSRMHWFRSGRFFGLFVFAVFV